MVKRLLVALALLIPATEASAMCNLVLAWIDRDGVIYFQRPDVPVQPILVTVGPDPECDITGPFHPEPNPPTADWCEAHPGDQRCAEYCETHRNLPRCKEQTPPPEPPPCGDMTVSILGALATKLAAEECTEPPEGPTRPAANPTSQEAGPCQTIGQRFSENIRLTGTGFVEGATLAGGAFVAMKSAVATGRFLTGQAIAADIARRGSMATARVAVETLIAGSANSTIAPGSTLLLGEGAATSAAAWGWGILTFAGGVTAGAYLEAVIYRVSCRARRHVD